MGCGSGVNAVGIAEATLRSNGGFDVMLRMPGLAVSGDDAEQLGLATPLFQDEPVGPAVWRKGGVDTALLLAASAVAALAGTNGFESAESLFEAAAGMVVGGVFYTIANSQAVVSGGVPCAYRVSLVGPARG